jgi:hypothetical protein
MDTNEDRTTHCGARISRVCRNDIARYATASICATPVKLVELVGCILRLSGFNPKAFEATPVKKPYALFIAGAIAIVAIVPVARPAQADTTSTIILAAAAGAIIGSLFTDSNNQPYYVNNGRHVYVSHNTATYYRAHGNNNRPGPQRDGQHRH